MSFNYESGDNVKRTGDIMSGSLDVNGTFRVGSAGVYRFVVDGSTGLATSDGGFYSESDVSVVDGDLYLWTAGHVLYLVNGVDMKVYSDDLTTLKLTIDGATGNITTSDKLSFNATDYIKSYTGTTADRLHLYGTNRIELFPAGTREVSFTNAKMSVGITNAYNIEMNNKGLILPAQQTTVTAPAYVKGAMYFDTTLNKLRIGGAARWETVTSV